MLPDVASSAPVMVGSLIPGSVAVSVHPLVLLNVSDHWTRMRTQQAEANTVQGGDLKKNQISAEQIAYKWIWNISFHVEMLAFN